MNPRHLHNPLATTLPGLGVTPQDVDGWAQAVASVRKAGERRRQWLERQREIRTQDGQRGLPLGDV